MQNSDYVINVRMRYLRSGSKVRRKPMKSATSVIALCALAGSMVAGPALADASKAKIALSNNFIDGSRQQMLDDFNEVGKKAAADHIVAGVDTFTTADKEVPTQAAQIENFVLQGYNAIVINASSPTALNGAVKQACDAGVVVVSFDNTLTEPCAYRITADIKGFGRREVEHMAMLQPKGGSLLEVRGLAGTAVDGILHDGIMDGMKEHPEFKIVASVEGDWDQTSAQKAVSGILPSLPPVVGVIIQGGGDGYGVAQAFATAGKPIPTIILGNTQVEFQWWKEQKAKTGYQTWSSNLAPGISTLAFWVTVEVLEGRKEVPHDIVIPMAEFNNDTFEAALGLIPKGGVADRLYTRGDAEEAMKANMK